MIYYRYGGVSVFGNCIYNYGDSNVAIYNSIFWNDTANGTIVMIYDHSTVPANNVDISYCCIKGITASGTNINDDPDFSSGSLKLSSTSPCIDEASNDAAEGIRFDITGRERCFDGDDVTGSQVDMGAYEFVP